ncbi:hypothetical protein PP182_08060 [Maribacter sp. PR1]|uniref:DUF3784 domain-containing protein n=1 Tax=Maribacter cobaltidurans TaxID=1178778 RepID=A0ABU7ITR9_9FLAO|nr:MULTISPECIES: hypothetical protein [Maribacter]MDC6388634.1 hypothetical protein [Maribacter sp. PR1]MEE1976023.1 hypothetical protein [Maribacter cobaltidurans]
MEFNAEMDNQNLFLYIVPVFALLGYFGSQFVFKNILSKIRKDAKLDEKLNTYQTASIIKYALIEGPAFLAIVAYNSSGNALPLVIGICLILYLAVQRPNREKIIESLPLTLEEKRKLEHH